MQYWPLPTFLLDDIIIENVMTELHPKWNYGRKWFGRYALKKDFFMNGTYIYLEDVSLQIVLLDGNGWSHQR